MKLKTKEKMQKLSQKWSESAARRRAQQALRATPRPPPPPQEASTSAVSSSPPLPPPPTSSPPPPPSDKVPYSRSKEKLEKSGTKTDDTMIESREFLLVDLENMLQWVRTIARCTCGSKMKVHQQRTIGMARYFQAKCYNCDRKFEMCTSQGGQMKMSEDEESENRPYDVHQKLVASTLHSTSGYQGVTNLCASFDMKPLSEKNYFKLAKGVQQSAIEKLERVMETTRSALHARLRKKGDNNQVKCIRVSCDGSWHKRGFTSMYGFVSVIEHTTGWCIDFVILSKWCLTCEKFGKNAPPNHDCTKNFTGSSPAMEREGWKILWQRSVEKCKFKYTEVVSDGDSKGISAVKDLDIYPVEKLECINHVSKRLGSALMKATKSLHLGGKKEGSLTQDKVLKLAHYFGNAIKSETTVGGMKRAIYATLQHCMSTDKAPKHNSFPDGRISWCFYKRSIAQNIRIPSHKTKMTTYLREDVVRKIMPIYQRIATPELLQKCQGDTQNANECLHSLIWSDLPKIRFYHPHRMQYSILRSVVQFNHGSEFLMKETGSFGPNTLKIRKNLDRKRVRRSLYKEEKKGDAREKKIRRIQEEEQKIAEEGETYGPGIAPV